MTNSCTLALVKKGPQKKIKLVFQAVTDEVTQK